METEDDEPRQRAFGPLNSRREVELLASGIYWADPGVLILGVCMQPNIPPEYALHEIDYSLDEMTECFQSDIEILDQRFGHHEQRL